MNHYLKKNLQKEYFDSIDTLPIWNWWMIAQSSNLNYLRVDGNLEKHTDYVEAWFVIQDEYLEDYGDKEALRTLLTLKKYWIEQQTKYIVDGDRSALQMANIIAIDMEDENDLSGYMKREDTIILLEEKLGREIDPKIISVRKYNNYINYYSN